MYQSILKSVSPSIITFAKSVDGKEHVFYLGKNGQVMHLCLTDGKSFGFNGMKATNAYPFVTYSHTSNCFYFFNLEEDDSFNLVEYNYQTASVGIYNYEAYIPSYTNMINGDASIIKATQRVFASTDGHLYFGNLRYRGLPGMIRFNTSTKTFDQVATNIDPEFEAIHGLQYTSAFKITTGSFAGIYVKNYHYNNVYNSIRSTIESDITTSGLAWLNTNEIWVHYSDREIGSSTRRIFTPIGTGDTWKFIDLKSPTTWLNSQVSGNSSASTAFAGTFIDQTGSAVSKTGWLSGTGTTFASDMGYTIPTLDPGLVYSSTRGVGRYAYCFDYMNNKNNFFCYAVNMTTGEVLYPNAFNKATHFLNNGNNPRIYKCNFGGTQGFSSSDEYVMFLKNDSLQWGYFRPDTDVFVVYDPVINSSGYVLALVNWESPTDVNAPGIYIDYFGSATEVEVAGDAYLKVPSMTGAINQNPELEIDPDYELCTVKLSAMTDWNNPAPKKFTFRNVPTVNGNISQAIEVATNKYVVTSEVYSGIAAINDNGANYSKVAYFSKSISPNGAILFSTNKVLSYGYFGTSDIIETASWPSLSKKTTSNFINELTYAAERNDCVLLSGIGIRVAGYKSNYFYLGKMNKTTYVQTQISTLPNYLNITNTSNLRTLSGLTSSSYTDGEAETALQNYMNTQGISRSTAISRFVDTCEFKCSGITTSGNEVFMALSRRPISALTGIRFEETVGSGVWIDSSYQQSTKYPEMVYFNKVDINTLSSSDFKNVVFEISGLQGTTSLGRIAVSDNYVAFLQNDHVNSKSVVRIFNKTNIVNAANSGTPITSTDGYVEINVGSTTAGFGDGIYFDESSTWQSNAFLTIGDYLYVTVKGVSNTAIYRINLTTSVSEVFATHNSLNTKSISYNSSTNKMLVSIDDLLFVINNVTTATLPVALI